MKDRIANTGHVGTSALGGPVERSSIGIEGVAQKPGLTLRVGAAKTIKRVAARLKSVQHIFGAALREIFDESAYARFLSQRQLVSSRAAYAAFQQEHEIAKARRPRCC